MSGSFTLKFDGWAPDLQNVAMEVDGASGSVACADVLNVYYQDAAFRCLPGPNPFAPALGEQALALFSGYDNISANNYLYAAGANDINIYQNGVWTTVPVEPSVTVGITGVKLGISLGGTGGLGSGKAITGVGMRITLGNINTSGGAIFAATMTSGFLTQSFGAYDIGFYSGAGGFGSLSRTTTYVGGISVLAMYSSFGGSGPSATQVILSGIQQQNYFTKVVQPASNISLTTASASLSYNGQTTIWTWSTGASWGNSLVELIL